MGRPRYEPTAAGPNGWSVWFPVERRGWRMRCCDCSLVHRVEFRVRKNGVLEMRAGRHERATAACRRAKRTPSSTA